MGCASRWLGSLADKWQVPVWVCALLLWYVFYVVSFCALVSDFDSYATVFILQVYNGLWIVVVISLFRASYAPPEAVPAIFHLPDGLFKEEDVFGAIGKWSKEHEIPARFHL
uniref:PhoLip_ATPase_C domain-containing protein n=1 Tax=Steinernema glaseri TaxID=37863 RepID=A0A1I7Z1V0_9BILA